MPEPQPPVALGPDDFQVLNDLSVGSLSGKKQADALIGKMTSEEKTAFYGYVNQLPHGNQASRIDSNIIGTPSGAGVAPEDVLMGGQALKGIAKAGPSLAAKAGEVVSQATPLLKYEFTKTTLEKMGVPTPLAMAAAIAVTGYRGNGKNGHATEAPSGPHLDRSVPVRPSDLTQEQIAQRVFQGTGTPPNLEGYGRGVRPTVVEPVSPAASAPVAGVPQTAAPSPPAVPTTPSVGPPPMSESAASGPQIRMGPDGRLVGRPGGNPDMPDQKALNEAALARRRQAVATEQTLLTAEATEYMRLLKSGKTSREALEAIQAMRGLGGLTDAERIAAQDARYARGEVKTPSAETARARRGRPE